MKQRFIFAVLFLLQGHILFSQNNRYIKGKLKLLNSTVYLAGINIKAQYNHVDYTNVTASDGLFVLSLPPEAASVSEVQMINSQYEIVEKEEVRDLTTTDDLSRKADVVLVCRVGELKKLSDKYFEALFQKERLRYERKIDSLRKTNQLSEENRKVLADELEQTKNVIRQQADFYSRFDLSDPIYKEAYEYFLSGQYERCLETLPSDDVVISAYNSMQLVRNRIFRTNLLKANSYEELKQYDHANEWFAAAIQTDKTNLIGYTSYATALKNRNDNRADLIYTLKAIRIAEEFDESNIDFIAHQRIRAAFSYGFNFSRADSGIYLMRQNLNMIAANEALLPNGFAKHMSSTLTMLADCYRTIKKEDSALKYFEMALPWQKEMANQDGRTYVQEVVWGCFQIAQVIKYNFFTDSYKNADSAQLYRQAGLDIAAPYAKDFSVSQMLPVDLLMKEIEDHFTRTYDDTSAVVFPFTDKQLRIYEPLNNPPNPKYAYTLATLYHMRYETAWNLYDDHIFTEQQFKEYRNLAIRHMQYYIENHPPGHFGIKDMCDDLIDIYDKIQEEYQAAGDKRASDYDQKIATLEEIKEENDKK